MLLFDTKSCSLVLRGVSVFEKTDFDTLKIFLPEDTNIPNFMWDMYELGKQHAITCCDCCSGEYGLFDTLPASDIPIDAGLEVAGERYLLTCRILPSVVVSKSNAVMVGLKSNVQKLLASKKSLFEVCYLQVKLTRVGTKICASYLLESVYVSKGN